MQFSEISAMADEDLKIDDTELDIESLRTPQLHNKYMKLYAQFSSKLKQTQDTRKTLYKEKWEYYTGKAPAEVYVEKPFDLKILKNDVQMYIEADSEYQEITQKEAYFNTVVDYLQKTIQQIANRSFAINNAIKWKMFLHGE